ncbi:hypothetical protein RHGRI_016632 [Rhododendron griersonianum]|uniref:Uncharacterized protein n=1 Tax=Rhododendron griersonianum TaxID=479676 RepID=A0AAV6JUW2_9ERIC|nr:hypothetical protein RHGRI_016632 [Rhododendron griersonianum]
MENRRKNTSNSQTRCKKHPKHQQSPGVCSICLGERLSQISTSSSSSSRRAVEAYCSSSSSSSLSSLSSSSRCSTSELSPVHHQHHHHHRVRSGTGAGVKWSKNNYMVFGKSRSMAFVGEVGERIFKNKSSSSSSGFWSKLLRPRSQKKNNHVDVGFGHSRTMRERMFATRVY